jgi:uncharacterized RDD family membrane protein YckC
MARFGGFWIRVVAYLIDAIIVNVASFVVALVLGAVMGSGLALGGSASAEDMAMAAYLGDSGLGLLLYWLYYAVMESSASQGTVGKMAFGLVVTDELGRRIGFGRATGRFFAKILSVMILMIGFLMVGWTARKQGLHDMVAGTLVMKKGALPDTANAAVFE